MFTAGIDMGARTIKVVILEDSKIASKSIVTSGRGATELAQEALDEAVSKAGIQFQDIVHVTATGVGKKKAPHSQSEITEVGAAAKGAVFLFPKAKTVIDVGAAEGRAIRCDQTGKVVDFAINEKCAAGAGAFAEAMARALEVSLEEFGALSLKSQALIPMNAQCAVFAESEVVSLIHAKTPKTDISHAIHDAIADRIASLVRRVGIEKDVVLVGGLARDPGFVDALTRKMEIEVLVPEEREFVGALGAALVAQERR